MRTHGLQAQSGCLIIAVKLKFAPAKYLGHLMSVKIIELDYLQDTAQYLRAVSDMANPVWLDSSNKQELGGRFDIISAKPETIIEVRGNTIAVQSNSSPARTFTQGNAFEVVREHLRQAAPPNTELPEHIPFAGGAIGYWGYSLGSNVRQSTTEMPDMRIGIYLWSLVADRLTQKAWLCLQNQCSQALRTELQKRFCVTQSKTMPSEKFTSSRFKPSTTPEQYRQSIDSIKEYITAGDCYQVNYSQEFTARYTGNPLAAYLRLRQDMPAHYSAYIGGKDGSICSFSPERFLTLSAQGEVSTKPIKGTAPRHHNPGTDTKNAKQLQQSAKDRAENIMIVDLMRNDLGRECAKGSISVDALCKLESFSNVHHLVSEITGCLKPDADALSLLESAFPAGSITGAPKRRAMEVIDELEQHSRSVYCGSIGYIGFDGRMDVNVAIRTLEMSGGNIFCRGGGGIVADSKAESEYQESLDKVSAIMKCIESNFTATATSCEVLPQKPLKR